MLSLLVVPPRSSLYISAGRCTGAGGDPWKRAHGSAVQLVFVSAVSDLARTLTDPSEGYGFHDDLPLRLGLKHLNSASQAGSELVAPPNHHL